MENCSVLEGQGKSGLPLVSIIIPCYNAENYVAEAIQAALDQTYPNCEVIVIDDGSTDRGINVIESFGDRIRWETGPNRGGSVARNRGLDIAKGEWIQFLDADDLISKNKISSQIQSLVGVSSKHVSVSNVVYFQDQTDPFCDGKVSMGYSELNSDDPASWLVDLWTPGPGYGTTRWGMVPHHAYLAPRSCIDLAGPWNESLSIDQDGEFFARVISVSKGVRWSEDSYAYYRKFDSRQSVSRGKSFKNAEASLQSVERKIQALEKIPGFQWSDAARSAIARQFMGSAIQSTPRYPSVALRSWKRSRDFGGYPASEFFAYQSKYRWLRNILPWPIIRIAQELRR